MPETISIPIIDFKIEKIYFGDFWIVFYEYKYFCSHNLVFRAIYSFLRAQDPVWAEEVGKL